MSSSAVLILVLAAALSAPEVTQSAPFTRNARAFKSYNQVTKKSVEDGAGQFMDTAPRLDMGSDLTVREMVQEMVGDRELARDFVEAFMDVDGNGMISARELLPPSKWM